MKSPEKIFEKNYLEDGKKILNIRKMDAHEINATNFIFTTTGGKFILKRYASVSEKRLKLISEVISQCRKDGVKVPMPIGDYIKENGHFYSCFRFVEGSIFDGSTQQTKEAARELASLHKSLSKIRRKIDRPDTELHNILTLEEVRKMEEDIGHYKKNIYQNLPFIKKEIVELGLGIVSRTQLERIPKQLVHNDYHTMNVLFNGDRLVRILDLDSIGTGVRVRDVAFAAQRFSKDVASAKLFIGEYNSHNKLSKAERNLIPHFAVHETMRRVSYILRSYYFHGDATWLGDFDKHIRNLRRGDAWR